MKTIFWAGDSTIKQNTMLTYPQTGLGQGLERYVKRGEVTICNCAENGRSTKSFIDEGRLAPIYDAIRPGDFLFITFGHNDEKTTDPARYAAPFTDYAANLERFVNAARNKQAIPVIITPLTRRCYRDPAAQWKHDDYALACKQTAERLGVALIDLTAMSERLVDEWGEQAKALYMHIPAGVYPYYPNGMTDNTHLTPLGANVFAGLVAKALHELGGVYAELLFEEYDEWLALAQQQPVVPQTTGAAAPAELDEDAAVGYGRGGQA